MEDARMRRLQHLRTASEMLFEYLSAHDLVDDPDFFNVLDNYLRERDYMICAEQKGVYGARIYFGRLSTHEG